MFYYINNFLLFSILGFFMETSLFKLLNFHNYSGFTYLWWTPFYGTGIIIINLVNNYFNKHFSNNKIKNILLFIFLFLILSLLELCGGHLLTLIHGYKLWTYKNVPLHIGDYISIPTSLLWTIMSFVYLYIIKKYSDKIIKKIPKWISITLSLLFISDLLFTLIRLYLNRT